MAETVVRYLIQHLNRLLEQESDLLKGVIDRFRLLKVNLELLQSFLTDFGEKWKEESIAKEAVTQIRDVVEEAEDVIDTFILTRKQQNKMTLVGKAVHVRDHSKMVHEVNNEMEGIIDIIRDIYDRKAYFNLSAERSSGGRAKALERLNLLRLSTTIEKDDVVGLEDDTENLVELLLGGTEQLEVVSIIGMGGIGKTTLAKIIYHDPRVKSNFNCRLWVSVSPVYDIGELKEKIRNCLKNERFLLVMDDVWEHDVLDQVRLALPDNKNKSRILITSRIKSVAGPGASQYSLPPLSKEESWELFSRKVFQGEECPSELEAPGREIVKRCRGLPISVVILGRLLAYKEKRVTTWLESVKNMDWDLSHHQTHVLEILALSYNDLAERLKLCFLYMVIYPQNFQIPIRQLIQLWVAEGFIQHTDDKIAEDVAEDCLAELIDRSLVQLSTKRTDGGVKTCRIHDQIRLLCQNVSKNSNFLELRTDTHIFSLTKPRRLSLHCSTPLYISSNPAEASSLRSLHCFGSDSDEYSLETSHWKWFYKSFRLIRVLNLGCVHVKAIPYSIKKLILLKYLKIESRDLKVVPASIGNLVNLQTLDLRYSFVHRLPAEIWKLQELRNVYVSGPVSLPKSSKTEALFRKNLQGISTVALDQITAELIKQAFFPNLRKLGLLSVPGSKCDPVEALAHLCNLRHLRTFKILGSPKLPSSPEAFPRSLSKITLKPTESLHSNAVITLSKLPNLQVLKLLVPDDVADRKKLEFYCDASGFPRLICLQMSRLHIEKHNIEEDAMPCLEKCNIKDCTWLSDSQEVQVLEPSSSLAEKFDKSLQKNGAHVQFY